MGVCCIVFDIDGIVFLNIEKNKIFFFVLLVYKKKIPGGGMGGFFFVEKQFFLISRFMLFSTLNINIEKCPFTYWLNGRWFLQIAERESIYISSIPLF